MHLVKSVRNKCPEALTEIPWPEDADNKGRDETEEPLVETDHLFEFLAEKLGKGWNQVALHCTLCELDQDWGEVREFSFFLPGNEMEQFQADVAPKCEAVEVSFSLVQLAIS